MESCCFILMVSHVCLGSLSPFCCKASGCASLPARYCRRYLAMFHPATETLDSHVEDEANSSIMCISVRRNAKLQSRAFEEAQIQSRRKDRRHREKENEKERCRIGGYAREKAGERKEQQVRCSATGAAGREETKSKEVEPTKGCAKKAEARGVSDGWIQEGV